MGGNSVEVIDYHLVVAQASQCPYTFQHLIPRHAFALRIHLPPQKDARLDFWRNLLSDCRCVRLNQSVKDDICLGFRSQQTPPPPLLLHNYPLKHWWNCHALKVLSLDLSSFQDLNPPAPKKSIVPPISTPSSSSNAPVRSPSSTKFLGVLPWRTVFVVGALRTSLTNGAILIFPRVPFDSAGVFVDRILFRSLWRQLQFLCSTTDTVATKLTCRLFVHFSHTWKKDGWGQSV